MLIALVSVAPAGAHAVLIETQPANGTVLETWPDRVLLRFNEPVDASLGALRVYDSDANRVDSGRTSRPDAQTVVIELDDRPLARGTYTVAWRIVSADSHPLHGAFVFSVKSKSDTTGVIAEVLKDDEVPREVSVGFTVTRFLELRAPPRLRRRRDRALRRLPGDRDAGAADAAPRILGVLAAVLAVASLVGIVFHGASAGGFGLGEALSWDVFRAVLDTRFGEVWLVRAGLAAGLALVAFSGVHPGFMLPFAVGLAWTLPAAGHANTAGALAFVMDLLHVLAASVWAGGLTFVLLALILARGGRWPLAAAIVPRFSALAVVSVAVLLVGGIVNGYLEVRAWSGLWETNYGRLLLAKSAIVLVLLGQSAPTTTGEPCRVSGDRQPRRSSSGDSSAPWVSSWRCSRSRSASLPCSWRSHRPGRRSLLRGRCRASAPIGPYELNLVVDPAEKGLEQHPSLPTEARTGSPRKWPRRQVSATLPDPGIGPLELEPHPGRAGPLQRARCGAATRR